MSTKIANTGTTSGLNNADKEYGSSPTDSNILHRELTHEERQTAQAAARFGYGPLTHPGTSNSGLLPAFGGEFQPGLYRDVKERKFANPAPLGLSAFAFPAFVLSLINMNTRGVAEPNIVVAAAFGYGGLVQLLAGMWAMAVNNTFAATALSSYGGFWLSFAIILTPGGFGIVSAIEAGGGPGAFYDSFGFFLMGWFIFTTLLLLATLRSTVAFFSLFFFLDLTFLLLGVGYLHRNSADAPNPPIIKAGGFFGLLTAFLAWYNAVAGILDDSNSFFIVPVIHLPWSATAKERSGKKTERETV